MAAFLLGMLMEEWRDAPETHDLFEVSNHGNVRYKRTKSPKPLNNRSIGYSYVHYYSGGKQYLRPVHRLVAIAFIPNPENKPFVNHKDGNKRNNHVENLEWCTASENSKHAYDTGLNRDSITKATAANASRTKEQRCEAAKKGSKKRMRKVVRNDGVLFDSLNEAAKAIGSTPGNVHNTISGRYKHTKGYSFKYYGGNN